MMEKVTAKWIHKVTQQVDGVKAVTSVETVFQATEEAILYRFLKMEKKLYPNLQLGI